jgi:hypothetical protein
MTDLSKTVASDVFSGCGNGTLHIAIVQDTDRWDVSAGDRHIGVCFNYEDWKSIFSEELHCPEVEPYVQGEDIIEHCERNRRLFQQSIPEYPMLSRIFDMYEDYVFAPKEVETLRQECLKLKAIFVSGAADLGLRKLIYACEEASKENRSLMFVCD